MKETHEEINVAELRERLKTKRVTEWLHPAGACGDSSYECTTNRGWLNAEVDRLKRKRIKATVVTYGGLCAAFRLEPGETAMTIQSDLRKLGDDLLEG